MRLWSHLKVSTRIPFAAFLRTDQQGANLCCVRSAEKWKIAGHSTIKKLHSHQIITQWNMIHWNRRRRIWPFGTALGEGYWAMKQIQIPSLWRIAKTKTVENDHAKHEHGALPAATLESNLTFSSPYSTGNRIATKKGTQLYHNQLHESIANHHRCCWPCLWHLR